ncbi:response regulator transcription factor [Pelomonas sp. SE-A7]|uniref:response regulator n=1 Tax=Pelomonas sp. SE-A7 TaxID=3054953 RepID=UPI00259CCE39|nr:response regulator transcription factor [Pelomonas sp. SE-A7]MDM4764551.1 response regulator transcription factor [Pelomonas sp. SE-A7]
MRVLLIDDHPLILSALQLVIEGLSDNVSVVGLDNASAARETLRADNAFDLVMLDLQLGDADGFDVLEEFRASYPALPVVVISASDRASDVIRAIDLGAMGFVPKRISTDMLSSALKLVMSGGIYVPPMAIGTNESLPAKPEAQPVRQDVQAFQPPASLDGLGLTPRQTDVLALLLQGLPNKLIARELGVSVDTVKDHVAAVLKALGVNSRTQAVLAVSQMAQRQPANSFSAWRHSEA